MLNLQIYNSLYVILLEKATHENTTEIAIQLI